MTEISAPSLSGGSQGNRMGQILFGGGLLDRLSPAWEGAVSGLLVVARLFLAIPFLKSGLSRVNSWSAQSYLFEYEHPLPLVSPTVAAYLTTGLEVVLPVALALGVLARFAGLGLGVMAATIYFVIGGDFAVAHEQIPWMIVALVVFVLGPGRISLDHCARLQIDCVREPGASVWASAGLSIVALIVLLDKGGAIDVFGRYFF